MNTAEETAKTREAFRSMLRSVAKDSWRPNYIATVMSVDTNAKTCDVKNDDGEEWADARLMSIIQDPTVTKYNYCCLYPTVGSLVLIEIIEGVDTQAVVVAFSEIDQIDVVIGKTAYNVKDGQVTYNGGNNGGMVIIGKLKDNLSAIKNYFNAMISAISAGFTAVGVGTAASGPNGATVFNNAMQSQALNFDDMENTAIKQ